MATLTTVTFSPPGTVAGTGCIDTGISTSLSYSGGTLGPGVVGNIKNLVAGGGSVDQFMTFAGTSLDFILDNLGVPAAPTNGTNCASTVSGQTCIVVAGSPFLLTNNADGTTAVTLGASGRVLDNGVTTFWRGIFATTLTDGPGTVQSTELAGGSETSTQGGKFTVTAVPEPTSFVLIGGGLLMLGAMTKRLRAR